MTARSPSPTWLSLLIAFMAGALLPVSLAPFNIWPLGIVSLAVLAHQVNQQRAGRCFLLALSYGLGLYGVGASWVYVSINQFGSAPPALAALLTLLFVVGLSLALALPFLLYGRFIAMHRLALVAGFPAFWVLNEWFRSWFLTGFPWLYSGYAHLHTPLAGWAPTLGVFGVSLAVAFTAAVLVYLVQAVRLRQTRSRLTWAMGGGLAAVWLTGGLLLLPQWTRPVGEPVSVGMAQGNIPQERKWDPSFRSETFRIFTGLSRPLWQHDWVIWPEAAIPLMYHSAQRELDALAALANQTDTVFITGILYDNPEPEHYYNSLVALGKGEGIEFKTRLVPFGEYVPLEHWLRGLIDFFNLPTSIIHPGPAYSGGLRAKEVIIAPTICYEVVYPDLVAARARGSHVLLTVSNDAWFGNSIGPVQHFQMAQMRALETGRYMVRSTNNGISGIINPRGKLEVVGGRNTQEAIEGSIQPLEGVTPFLIWRSWPVVLGSLLVLAGLALRPGSRRLST